MPDHCHPITTSKSPIKRNWSKSNLNPPKEDRQRTPSLMGVIRASQASRLWQRFALNKRSGATTASISQTPKVQFENTYRMQPKNGEKFREKPVRGIIENAMKLLLDDADYDRDSCKDLCKDLSRVINDRVKSLDLPRYKFVCHVTLLESQGQGVHVDSRCLWNDKTDNFSTCTFRNSKLIAVANVYATYFD